MRELTRKEKLLIALDADRIEGVDALADDGLQIAEVNAALQGRGGDNGWYGAVRGLAAAAMNTPAPDVLTDAERAAVEFYREDNSAPSLLAIIDRLAPKVGP